MSPNSAEPRRRDFFMGLRARAILVAGSVVIGAAWWASAAPRSQLQESATETEQKTLAVLKVFVDEFAPITPGRGKFPAGFSMGSKTGEPTEQPVHEIRFDYDFSIARYEVPQNLYAAVMGGNPSRWRGPRNSAEMMTWDDANRFCESVTHRLQRAKLITPEQMVRLPSEAEWEYCCRAGTKTAYSFGESARGDGDSGNQASRLDDYAWHTGNAAGNDPPVGALEPNPWGLYDMHGYLWEFVADQWHPTHEDAPTDGSARDGEGTARVARGGSWEERYDKLRSSSRRRVSKTFRSPGLGFRCVLAQKS